MNKNEPVPGIPTRDDAKSPADRSKGSGEGASTALEAMLRKRRQGENADPAEAQPPVPPPAPA